MCPVVSSAPRIQELSRLPSRRAPCASNQTTLSNRQLEVAQLVGEGLSNTSIAERLVITPGTVANHVQHILVKLGMRTRVQIALWVVARQGVGPSTQHDPDGRELARR